MPLEYEERIIDRFQMGADKYARDDWRKATWNDRQTYYASIHRHLRQAQDGDKSEDHLAALIVDAIILMHAESEPARVVSEFADRIKTWFCPDCDRPIHAVVMPATETHPACTTLFKEAIK
jgi:hypothetical protein